MIDFLATPLGKYYLSALLAAYPVYRIYTRVGFSGLWTLFLAVPFVGFLLCMGALALRRWPQKGVA